MMEKERKTVSYFHKDLSISIAIPANWDLVQNDDFALAAIEKKESGFRANVGFNVYKLEGDDPQKFQSAIDSALKNLSASYKDYKSLSKEQVWIDGYPSFHHEYSWNSENLVGDLQQSMTLIFVFPNRLYEVIGSVEQNNYLNKKSILENIVSSFRFIEPI